MGFTPAEVGRMTMWEFAACLEGWRQANSSEAADSGPMSDADFAAAAALVDSDRGI